MGRGLFRNRFRMVFRTERKNKETVNWVAEVDPQIRNKLRREGRLFIVFRSLEMVDYVVVVRSFKC